MRSTSSEGRVEAPVILISCGDGGGGAGAAGVSQEESFRQLQLSACLIALQHRTLLSQSPTAQPSPALPRVPPASCRCPCRWRSRTGCRWRQCRSAPQSGARRGGRAECRPGGRCPGTCCREQTRAHPATGQPGGAVCVSISRHGPRANRPAATGTRMCRKRKVFKDLPALPGGVYPRQACPLPAHLQHVDLHAGLAVGGGGEDLVLAGGQGGVAGDDLRAGCGVERRVVGTLHAYPAGKPAAVQNKAAATAHKAVSSYSSPMSAAPWWPRRPGSPGPATEGSHPAAQCR